MALVAIVAVVSFLCANGFYDVGLWGSVAAAAVFGVCQVGQSGGEMKW